MITTSAPVSDNNRIVERRQVILGDILGKAHYYDIHFGTMVHKINEGGFCVLSDTDHLIMTTLGSCISVCMFDHAAKVGGMNHFLLPEGRSEDEKNGFSLRYGNNAMEMLINEILKRGGQKNRLIVKAFGAGNVLNINANIGQKNQNFLKQYIEDERMRLEVCDLGGDYPRRVVFYPSTGKAFVKLLRRVGDKKIVSIEEGFRKKIEKQHQSGDIELF